MLPAGLFEGLGRGGVKSVPNTLYEHFQDHYGITVHHAEERLRAVSATQVDAERLQVAVNTPLLKIERIAYGLDGRAVELRISRCQTEHYHYHTRVT